MNRRDFLKFSVQTGAAISALPIYAAGASTNVRFLRPKDGDYKTYQGAFNTRIEHKPAVIALCQNETGVREAIKYARDAGLRIAIKSGGHHFDGYCSNDDGLVIDLTLMNQHQLLANNRYRVGPSCRIIQVYEELIPKGRLVPTGSCAMVGMSGITLGGGYGLYARQHGLTCDWLRRARLVDGRGQVHEVREGDELMWALRGGGGGGLGVVTELEYDTAPSPKGIWRYLFRSHNLQPKEIARKTHAWFNAASILPRDAFGAYILSGTSLTFLVTSTTKVVSADLKAALDALRLHSQEHKEPRYEPLPAGTRRYYGRTSPLPFRNASAGYYQDFDSILPVITLIAEHTASNKGLLYQINTLGGAIDDAVPDNHSVYAHRGYPFIGEIQSYWTNPEQAAGLIEAVREVQALFSIVGIDHHYANYADGELIDWQMGYYGTKGYARLQQIKSRYDPDDMFRHPQSIRLPG